MNEPLPQVRAVRPELPTAVDDVIQQATAKTPGDRFANAPSLADALRQALGLSAPPAAVRAEGSVVLANPYRGLQPFQEADAPFFFGREAAVQQLITRLQESEVGCRFLAVVGPSGSGKSSLIRAGLLPALRAGVVNGSEDWYVVDLSPGDQPQENLALGLLSIATESRPDCQSILQSDKQVLLTAVELVLPKDKSELLLVIDQFEALFDSSVPQIKQDLLLSQICAAVTSPKSRVRVLVGLRADYYDRPLANADFGRLLGRHTATVSPLTNEELLQAIEKPAKKSGAEMEPGLVVKIAADMHEQSGALPMLQYALTELFDRRRGRWLSHEVYRAIGGLSGALVQRAESLYCALDVDEQRAARQLFLRLVSLGEEARDSISEPATRRRVLLSELESLHDRSGQDLAISGETPAGNISRTDSMTKVVETFGAARLLTFDREPATRAPIVEVAHEACFGSGRGCAPG